MEMKTKIDCVCEVFDTMLSCFKSEISNGLMNVNTEEAGQVADIIKDMSETEKNLYEANYYKLVSESMEEKSKPENKNRRMGYNWNEKPYIDAYLHDPDFEDDMRYGYNATGYNGSASMRNSRMGYVDWEGSDEYMEAKRHYSETHSSADREKLMKETINTFKEMWGDADPVQRSKMKTELSALVNGLNA